MSTRRIVLLVSCLFCFASGSALADRAEDHEAINALMWRYARALDTFNPEAYAAVFTEDGQFGTGDAATKGRQALKDMIQGLRDGREERAANGETVQPMFHMTADTWTEFLADDHALHHSYWMTNVGAAGGQPAAVIAVGRGVDELVKVNGQWLIKVRNVAPD